MKPTIITGRAFTIERDGRLIENIDTDMIFHNRHLAITEIAEMGQHTFGNLDNYTDFPKRVQPGDILFVGSNFGCGSSRQQAVDCFRSLGVSLIVGLSFGAIYYRNAVNSAMPIIVAPAIEGIAIETGDQISVDLGSGLVDNITKSYKIEAAHGFSKVQKEIYRAGSIFALGKTE